MKRILLVKTSSLGDVIHNLPVINDIKAHHPQISIDWVVEESFAVIPELHTGVNQIYKVAMRRWRKQLFKHSTWREMSAVKSAIAAEPYDLIIDTQSLLKSAVIASWATGSKHGLDQSSAREPLASRFYEHNHTVPRTQHAVQRNRALAALACGYAIPTDAPDYGLQRNTLQNKKVDMGEAFSLTNSFIIGLHGTSRDSKLWPVEQWVALGELLAAQQLNLVLPWASDAEHERAQAIAAELNNAQVLPKQSIAQLAAITARAQAAVGVDTGLSHLATALNIPTIAIYTDTDPALTGVHPGRYAPALNLGNVAQTPSTQSVFDALMQIKPT